MILSLIHIYGHLIEKGTHDELIHQDGFYKQLYNAQFQDM